MGQTKEQKIIKQVVGKPTEQKFTPIATDMFLPNHSGDHSAGHTGTPVNPTDIANKAYVDGIIDPLNISQATIASLQTTYGIYAVSGIAVPRAVFEHQTASGSDGGSSTAGSYQVRPLNTTVWNDIPGCSISSNTITLAAGTYIFSGWQSFHRGSSFRGRIRVRDTTHSVSLLGESAFGNDAHLSIISKPYNIVENTDFQFQYFVDGGKTVDGLGVDTRSGENNVFASLSIEKVS